LTALLSYDEECYPMSEPFLAEIRIVGFNFAPRGWDFCNGQLLPIGQNMALFSLVGTTYGGDGRTNFGLPNLQGRAPMHPGRGPALTERRLGQWAGTTGVTLSEAQMPYHRHTLQAQVSTPADTDTPTDATWTSDRRVRAYNTQADTTMDSSALPVAGGSLPHNNMQPYFVLNFVIALQGIYPPRS
jgi:microcystin-dependent protein